MFADHAAIVPRVHAESFFVGVGLRLTQCAQARTLMPPTFTTPEAFLLHALIEQGASAVTSSWLMPLVVSLDGRAAKWCMRYAQAGAIQEILNMSKGWSIHHVGRACRNLLDAQDHDGVERMWAAPLADLGSEKNREDLWYAQHCAANAHGGT